MQNADDAPLGHAPTGKRASAEIALLSADSLDTIGKTLGPRPFRRLPLFTAAWRVLLCLAYAISAHGDTMKNPTSQFKSVDLDSCAPTV